MTDDSTPRIGLFWFIGAYMDELVDLSHSVADIPDIGGLPQSKKATTTLGGRFVDHERACPRMAMNSSRVAA